MEKLNIRTVKNTSPAFKSSADTKELGKIDEGTIVSTVKGEENGRVMCYFNKIISCDKISEEYYMAWICVSDIE